MKTYFTCRCGLVFLKDYTKYSILDGALICDKCLELAMIGQVPPVLPKPDLVLQPLFPGRSMPRRYP